MSEQTHPIIGLTTYGRHERKGDSTFYDGYFFIPADYVDAVRRAGGVPLLLPPGETNWQRWLDVTDGIIIIGGSDLDPATYGGNVAHPKLSTTDPERDASELTLVRELLDEKEQPFLAICRGIQVLNVAMGGTLHEHLPDAVGYDIPHRGKRGWGVELIKVNGQVAEVMGSAEVNTRASHHQAIKNIADGLEILAQADDGIIEACQVSDHPWALAVQWHPEKSAGDDPAQQRLFDELVEQARQRISK